MDTSYLFLSGMTLEGSRPVVSKANIQTHSFKCCWNGQDHGRLPPCTCPNIDFLHGAYSLKITVRCLTSTQAFAQKLAHVCWIPWSALQKKKKLWARPPVLTPVPSQAIHRSPPIAVGSRRVDSRETCTHVSDCLGRVSRHSYENCRHRRLLGLCFKLGKS